jgi:transposase
MQDQQLYAEILGIQAPWFVDRVELKLGDGEVHVHLEHQGVEQWPCPECGEACRQYDHQPERRWRHLDTCQYRTILHARPPRGECHQHGVRVVKLPWAEPGGRFTALFEHQPRALDLRARGAKKLESIAAAIIDEVLAKLAPIFE